MTEVCLPYIASLKACTEASEVEQALMSFSAIENVTDDMKKVLYKALAQIDPSLLNNAKLRRRLKRLMDNYHVEGCEHANDDFINKLRSVATLEELSTTMNNFQLKLPTVDENNPLDALEKDSYQSLHDTLNRILTKEWMTKIMKRRVTRMMYVISTSVLGNGKKAVAATTPVVTTKVDNAEETPSKLTPQGIPNPVPTENATVTPNDSETIKKPSVAKKDLPVVDSIDTILLILKEHAAKNTATDTNAEANTTPVPIDMDVLHSILNTIIEFVVEQAQPEGAEAPVSIDASKLLTSQKRRLLRRALDRIDVKKDFEASEEVSSVSKNNTVPLLLKKSADVMAFLSSGDNTAIVKAAALTPSGVSIYRPILEKKRVNKPRKYTVFVGQLSFYTKEKQLKDHIVDKLTAIPEGEPVPSNFDEMKTKFASSVCVRLLTDPETDSTPTPTASTDGIRNCRGMAFVDFSTSEDQLKCIKLLHKSGFNGRIINVERCDKKKSSNSNGKRKNDFENKLNSENKKKKRI